MELVVTDTSGAAISAQMQKKLASALDDGHRHLVTVRKGERGRLWQFLLVAACNFMERQAIGHPAKWDDSRP
jgi:hypothetical protein